MLAWILSKLGHHRLQGRHSQEPAVCLQGSNDQGLLLLLLSPRTTEVPATGSDHLCLQPRYCENSKLPFDVPPIRTSGGCGARL